MGDYINFILGRLHKHEPNEWGTKWLPWQRRLLSNGDTKSAFYGRIFQKLL